MIRTLILLGFIASVTAFLGIGENKLWEEALKYKFDPMRGFIECPRTIKEAKEDNCKQVENPDKTSGFADLTHWLKEGDGGYLVSFLFDENELIAGIQINQPENMVNSYFDPEKQGFRIWNHEGVNYAYFAMYFVSEDKQTRINSYNASKVLRSDHVTVTSLNNEMDTIPTDCRNLDTIWRIQACVMMMGTHYYYNMTESLTCDEPLYPWFPLTDKNTHQLIGIGLMYIGKSDCELEAPSTAAVKMIVPTGPQCLYDMVDKYHVTTLHTYFVDAPRFISC